MDTPELDWEYQSKTLAKEWEERKEMPQTKDKPPRATSTPRETGMIPPIS